MVAVVVVCRHCLVCSQSEFLPPWQPIELPAVQLELLQPAAIEPQFACWRPEFVVVVVVAEAAVAWTLLF